MKKTFIFLVMMVLSSIMMHAVDMWDIEITGQIYFTQSTTVYINTGSGYSGTFYTTDGSDPSDASNDKRVFYTDGFEVTETCTVRAYADDENGNQITASRNYYKSESADFGISIEGENPFWTSTTVTIKGGGDIENIVYTIDGSAPQNGNGFDYNGPFELTEHCTVRAIAYDPNGSMSDIADKHFWYYTVQAPTISGVTPFADSTVVTISGDADDSLPIFYTIDGSEPAASPDGITTFVYVGPFTITETCTIKAAYGTSVAGELQSPTATKRFENWTIYAPVISGNTPFYGSTLVTITDGAQPGWIFYTLDGSDPTDYSGNPNAHEYTGPFTISESCIVRAVSVSTTYSPVVSKEFIKAQIPAPIIDGETPFAQSSEVTISLPEQLQDMDNFSIYYTTNGTDPSDLSNATLYTAPFTVYESTTVKAIILISGTADMSDIASKFLEKDPSTGIKDIYNTSTSIYKTIDNGQVIITKNGRSYNIMGQPVK